MEQQDVTTPVTTKSAGIRFGLIGAVVGIAYFIILQVAGLDMQGPAGWVGYLFTAALIFFAHKYYKENGDGFLNYSQGIGIAFWLGLISGVISSIFTYIYVKFIDAGFIDKIKDQQYEQMQSQGMSDEQIEQAMKIAGAFTSPEVMLIMGLLGSILVTVVIALIITLITQNKRPDTGGALDA